MKVLRGKKIIFDEWVTCEPEHPDDKPVAYVGICYTCAVAKKLKKEDLIFDQPADGTNCDVLGCNDEANMFIDFEPDEYEILNQTVSKAGKTSYKKLTNIK